MRKTAILLSAILSLPLLMGCKGGEEAAGYASLKSGFAVVPDSVQTSAYWHWISGNISKAGVIADLEAMKKAGINRAFIANIGLPPNEAPTGDVKIFSDEWWDIMHAALKKATELNIEIGIFNSPGWSQAGGPWVKPSQSMRRISSVGTTVHGGGSVTATLKAPSADFQDVRVLAFPAHDGASMRLSSANCKITSTAYASGVKNLFDGDEATTCTFDKGGSVEIRFEPSSAFTLRALRLELADHTMSAKASVSVKENGAWRELKNFTVNRVNAALNTGFVPYAPVVESVEATTGKEFKLVLSDISAGTALKEVVMSAAPMVESYADKTLAKMYHSPLPYWKEYQWPVQPAVDDPSLVVAQNQVRDITSCLKGDVVTWDAPAGDWRIVRYGMLPTYTTNGPALSDGLGLEIDKLSKTHLKSHYDAFVGEILRRIPAADRKTWKVVVADSYEVGGQNFTDDFLDSFKQRYGYSALPFLPVYDGVVVGSEDASDRFLWDMRRFVADRLAYDHIGELARLSHNDGMTTWLENYGHWGFMGEFLQYGGQSDEVAGEFWSEGELGNVENRAASSCAHIYGKQKVSSESFTCGGDAYRRYPNLMKQRGDRFFAEGINNTLLHVVISQKPEYKLPGLNAPYSNEFNRNNTWYPQLDLFTTYLKRCNLMLQQGVNVADVCYFIGEDAPKMTGLVSPELPKGYQFDYINAEVIIRDMTVKNGLLTLPHGTSYRMMVLPPLTTMRPELMAKIRQLVADGGVIIGSRPDRSPSLEGYPQCDDKVRTLADEVWGNVDGKQVKSRTFGKGTVMCGVTMEEALAKVGCVPDCAVSGDAPVAYSHRQSGGLDIYFVANQSTEPISFTATFRSAGRQPELWEPTTGVTRQLGQFTQTAATTAVPMKLQPLESVLVVFAANGGKAATGKPNFPDARTVATLDGGWTAAFDAKMRGPHNAVKMDALEDLSKSTNDSIRYYSGTIVYTNSFNLASKPKGKLFLNLGDVTAMAKIKVNGQYVGGVWTAPYRVDISHAVRKGDNSVEIEVVNTWVNRLIGDAHLPADERPTWSPTNPWTSKSPLQKSGLVGPVVVESLDL